MQSARRRLSPRMENLEGRELLSTGAPVLTMNRLDAIVGHVEKIAGRMTRTHDTTQASALLTRLASRTPLGSGPLAATWQNEIHSASNLSRIALRDELARALYNDVLHDVAAGTLRVVGPGSLVFRVLSPTPAPGEGSGGFGGSAPGYINVTLYVYNYTSYQVSASIKVPGGTPDPQTIAPNGGMATYYLTFNPSASLYITVSDTAGIQPPYTYPYTILSSLNNSYNGVSYNISQVGSYFSVSTPYINPK
jgi:hypothetical protein